MRRLALIAALGFTGLLILFVFACCATTEPPPRPGERVHPVWIVSHGWHAGIAVRAEAVPPNRWPERADFPGAAYLEVGWGDAGYYPDPDPSLLDLLRAGLWATPSVVHVAGFARPPPEAFPHREVLRLAVSEAGLRALLRFIHDAHARDSTRAEPVGEGLYGRSFFYRGTEPYYVLQNCNTWVARALHTAGHPVAPRRALTVGALLRQLRPLAEEIYEPAEE